MDQVALPRELPASPAAKRPGGKQADVASPLARKAFIDDYLRMRMYEPTDANRIIISCGIDAFGAADPANGVELTRFLDQLYSLYSL